MSRASAWFSDDDISEILSVSALEPIGPITWNLLYQHFDSFQELLSISEKGLIELGLTAAQANSLANRPKNTLAVERLCKSHAISIITIEDERFPALLKEINDPPLWLFVRGDLTAALAKPTLTVVGTRKPSAYALAALDKVLPESIATQLSIISGLAYGVDKKAHQIALQAKSSTVAVLAGGLDQVYPAAHSQLANQVIGATGALVSEYPPLSRPKPYRFPVRNRIIAGLSRATVIVEAAIKSGTLTTAKSALEYNRDILAIPGDITRESAEGTNFLIQNGAALLSTHHQLMEYYQLKDGEKSATIDNELQKILDLLIDAPCTIDDLVTSLGWGIEQILPSITQLELANLIYQPQPGSYQKR